MRMEWQYQISSAFLFDYTPVHSDDTHTLTQKVKTSPADTVAVGTDQ